MVPADKASNNIVFVCKSYYYECLIKELEINEHSGNPTYKDISFDKDEILANHIESFMASSTSYNSVLLMLMFLSAV